MLELNNRIKVRSRIQFRVVEVYWANLRQVVLMAWGLTAGQHNILSGDVRAITKGLMA